MLKDVSNTKAPMDVPVDDSLTPAAIQTMYRMNSSDDNKFFVPTVQVYRIKKNFSSAEGEHWSVALSDGQFYIYGICDCELVNFIHSHIIAQNAIIRVHKFHMLNRKYRGRDTKVVRLIEAAKAAPNPGYPIGIPLNIQDDDRNENEESAFVNLSVAMADGPHAVASSEAFFSIRQKGRWQDDYRDFHHRRDMVKNLIRLLSEKVPQEKLERIPALSERIELALYQQASSFDTYIKMSTLKKRLKRLENSISSLDASKPSRPGMATEQAKQT